MTQICLPELWLSEWEMNILVGWEQLSHRMFYLPYPQPGLILDLCQSPFLSLKINENYLISRAQIKMYASFISTTIFCFLPMLYLKAHKTNGFVLIKRKALETSYSLAAQSCTDECKLLINPFKLKDVVKLTVFWKPGGICRHVQHQGTYLFTSMLQRNTFRKQQESPTQETWEETSSCNSLGLFTHNLLCYLHFQGSQRWLQFVPKLSSAWKTITWLIIFQLSQNPACPVTGKLLFVTAYAFSVSSLAAVKRRNYHHLFIAATYDCFWKHFQTFSEVQADDLALNLLWT